MAPKSKARGLRNNNPGNLRISKDPWQGLADEQRDPDFFTFVDAPYGIRAIARTLITYQDRHGCRTIAQIIKRWAPPEDKNDTPAYVAMVARKVGVDPHEPIDVQSYAIADPLVKAIILQENGSQPYSQAQIDKGLLLAGIEPPRKSVAKTPEVKAGTVAAGAAGAGMVAEAVRQAEPALPFLHLLTDLAPWVVGVVVLAVVGWIVWSRLDDRKKGLR